MNKSTMSVLRKIGRFLGSAVRQVGKFVGNVAKPIGKVAGALAPLAPAVENMGPYGAIAARALTLAPGVIASARGVANVAEKGGRSLEHAANKGT
jgi:hypothetical protein